MISPTSLTDMRYLVCSGGAMNGLAYVGVLQLLQQLHTGLYEQMQGYAGTSIGALVALLLNLGYTADTMRAVIEHFDASVLFRCPNNLLQPLGMMDAQASLGQWVGELIVNYMGRCDVTFAELFRRTRQELTVVVTNLSLRRVEYWNRHTQPAKPVCTAVTCSMALPILFAPVSLDGCLYIDGGLGDNFPTHVYPPHSTLGLQIHLQTTPPYDNIVDYAMALIELKGILACATEQARPQCTVIGIPGSASLGINLFTSALERRRIMSRGVVTAVVWALRSALVLYACCRLLDVPWHLLVQQNTTTTLTTRND